MFGKNAAQEFARGAIAVLPTINGEDKGSALRFFAAEKPAATQYHKGAQEFCKGVVKQCLARFGETKGAFIKGAQRSQFILMTVFVPTFEQIEEGFGFERAQRQYWRAVGRGVRAHLRDRW